MTCVEQSCVNGADIVFKNIEYSVTDVWRKEKKTILHNISGHFPSGKLTCILGPSGAGKTTLLNILIGLNKRFTGTLQMLSEKPVGPNRKVFNYVPSENVLHGLLTLDENLKFAIDLKLGNSISTTEKLQLVDDIVMNFGLDGARTTRTSKLSGGECKRLSIALEIVDDPLVLFLDEPTSGLDGVSGKQCLKYLKLLSEQGKTVVCSLHQPNLEQLKLFDHIYILAQGRCIYTGVVNRLLLHLEGFDLTCSLYHNPADFVIEIANGEYGSEKIKALVWSCENGKRTISHEDTERTDLTNLHEVAVEHEDVNKSNLNRIMVLSKREYQKLCKDVFGTYLRILVTVFMAVCVGILYWDIYQKPSKLIFIYNMILCSCILVMTVSFLHTLMNVPLEIAVIKRECFNRYYSIGNYIVMKLVMNIPLTILCSFISGVIIYYATALPVDPFRIGLFLFINIALGLTTQSISFCISVNITEVKKTLMASYVIHLPMIVFSGFGILLSHIPRHLYWLTYIMYASYALCGKMKAIYGFDSPKLDCETDYCHYSEAKIFLRDLGIGDKDIWSDFLMLLFFYVFFYLISYVGLKRTLNR